MPIKETFFFFFFLNANGILYWPLLLITHYNVCSMITSFIYESTHLFISSLHLTMSSCFGNHLIEIHTFLQLGFLLQVHSLLKSSSHISSSKRFDCRHHPVSYESYDIRRFLRDKTIEFFDEKIKPPPRFKPRTSCSVVHCDDH